MTEYGRILEVNSLVLGDVLASDATAGATSLTVLDAVDFSEDGGWLRLNDAENIEYSSVDDETGVITLVTPTTLDASEGDSVYLYDDRAAAVMTETVASVLAEGDEDFNDDALEAYVPHHLIPLLPEGIRASNGELVAMEWRGEELWIVDIHGQTPVFDGSVIDPATLPTPGTDGNAPATSPTPTTLGGLGMIFVKWTAPANNDFLTYEVHVATTDATPPVAGDTTTMLMETSSTMIAAKHLADGTPFEYDDSEQQPVSYYFAIIAKDDDGAGPAGTWVSGTMNKTASPDIAIGSITAEQLDAVMALVSTISTRSKDADGNLTGAGTDMTTEGLFSYKSDGTTRFELPNDPLLPAVFRGDAEIENLTVNTLTTLVQSSLSENATFTLQSSIQSPTNAPTVAIGYATKQFTVGSGSWSTRYSWCSDGTYSYTWNQDTLRVEKYSNSTGLRVAYSSPFFGGTQNASVAYDSLRGVLWLWNYDGSLFHLSKFTTALVHGGTEYEKTAPDENSKVGCVTYDPVNDELVVAKTNTTTGEMKWYRYDADEATLLAHNGTITSSSTYNVNTMTAIRTTADFGVDVVIAGNRNSNSSLQTFTVSGSTATSNDVYEWPTGTSADKLGAYYNTSTGKFVMLDQNGVQVTYEKDGNYWTTGGETEDWQACFTWYNTTGTKETTRSDFATFTMSKRAKVTITSPAKPTGTTHARFFLRKYAANENLNDSYLQGSSSATSPTLAVTNAVFSGTTSPSTNTFGSGTPSKVVSSLERADGDPKVEIAGDGSGRFDGLIPPGCVQMWAGTTVPVGWLLCDGTAYSTATYADLYNAIGTNYGSGTGTFNVPNLVGKFPHGGALNSTEGDTGGAATVTLSSANLPTHTHTMTHDHTLEFSAPTDTGGNYPQRGGASNAVTSALPIGDNNTANTGNGGFANSAFSILPPYVNLNFIIKY